MPRLRFSPLAVITLLGILTLIAVGSACGSRSNLEPAPDFQFSLYQGEEDLGGAELSLSDLRGKPLVLNFWAGLCPPCRAEMPEFQEFYDEYGDRVNILGLDVGPFTGLGSNKTGRGLLNVLNIHYPAGTTSDGQVVLDYRIPGMPSTYFITADGKIFRRWTGRLDKDNLVRITGQLLEHS